MADAAALRKEIEWAEAHPEEWDQRRYGVRRFVKVEEQVTVCGTACCIAGHTAITHGAVLEFEMPSPWQFTHGHPVTFTSECRTSDGQLWDIDTYAKHILGLEEWEAEALFDANNTVTTLWHWANLITHGEVEIPPEHAKICAVDLEGLEPAWDVIPYDHPACPESRQAFRHPRIDVWRVFD